MNTPQEELFYDANLPYDTKRGRSVDDYRNGQYCLADGISCKDILLRQPIVSATQQMSTWLQRRRKKKTDDNNPG